MYFNAEQTQGAIGAVSPQKSAGPGQEPNRNLSPKQFGNKPEAEGAGEAAEGAGAAEGAAGAAAGAEGAAAGGGLADLAALALL